MPRAALDRMPRAGYIEGMSEWPFHPGELEAQRRAGVRGHGGGIRSFMADQHRSFFAQLPFVVVGSVHDGAPVASLWTGAPGFVQSPDPETLAIATTLDPADPASAAFVAGAPFALLGIQPLTRRRNRANGMIARADEHALTIAIAQSFGNCPQYIHPRALVPVAPQPAPTERLAQLDDDARAQLAAADTFFVASAARLDEPNGGVDISHRGGPTGFVRVVGDVLHVPDYSGNRYFNTLGNLLDAPRAALIFPDFATGDVLHLQGTTRIAWDAANALPGAERVWQLRVERAWRRRGALALRLAD